MPGSQGIPGGLPGSTAAGGGDGSGSQTSSAQQGPQSGDSENWDTAEASQNRGNDIDFSEASGGAGSNSSATAQSASSSGGGASGGGQPSGGAVTGAEQVAILERELEGSMRDYDGMILRERNYVLSRANNQGSEAELEEFDRTLSYYEEGDLSDQSEPAAPTFEEGDGTGTLGDDSSDGTVTVAQGGDGNGIPGSGGNDVVFPPPDDIPSGNDDDVVARQIREAAMHEKDPELREKLWEEYRKYKNLTK